ncbi:hypothetical protein NOL04_06590 [Streptococcus suis]|nr:hypothetical protein [Streptococcus suis]HEL1761620.1 hypothetical protein [Streptococcus suis]HEM5983925.1 hypothetical protein [Streptococcus suis]
MKIRTLDCGCQRQLEDVVVNGEVHEIQVFGHTPDDPPLSQEDKEKIARIIENFLASKEQKEETYD